MSGAETLTSIIEWPVPDALRASPAVANRNLLARKYRTCDPDTILKNYVYMDRKKVLEEFSILFESLRSFAFRGRGIEIGAGVAVFSAMVCREFPGVESIHAIEVVPDVVRFLQPVAIRHIAGDRAAKIVSVIGSFDHMRLGDGQYDFCIEIGSLHHSDQLVHTPKEIAAKLKPGGHLIMVDRAHHNSLTERQRELILNVEYRDEWKRQNGYPPDRLTRRENGEHEITLREWYESLEAAGFEIERRFELRAVSLKKFLRNCLLMVPFPVRERLNWLPSRVRPQEGGMWWMLLGTCSAADAPSRCFIGLFVTTRPSWREKFSHA
ncbi:MAG: class I SAM-dependent methyltransferase [Armatimonadetes bacterium]|nr:class I SAM-dependent methyltransferase [Armatimonadota bacterium]